MDPAPGLEGKASVFHHQRDWGADCVSPSDPLHVRTRGPLTPHAQIPCPWLGQVQGLKDQGAGRAGHRSRLAVVLCVSPGRVQGLGSVRGISRWPAMGARGNAARLRPQDSASPRGRQMGCGNPTCSPACTSASLGEHSPALGSSASHPPATGCIRLPARPAHPRHSSTTRKAGGLVQSRGSHPWLPWATVKKNLGPHGTRTHDSW